MEEDSQAQQYSKASQHVFYTETTVSRLEVLR